VPFASTLFRQKTRRILTTQLPVDLRLAMVSTLLVVGGTPSLPGFIPRLRTSLLYSLHPQSTSSAAVDDVPPPPLHTLGARREETKAWRKRHQEPYKELYPLASKLAILNDPCPLDTADGAVPGGSQGGSAPRWKCGLMAWVGGSLAG
jgi:actin-related protein 10